MSRISEDEPKPVITEEIRQKRALVWKVLAAMLAGFVVVTTLLFLVLWLVLRS